jgi:hypothetical protein
VKDGLGRRRRAWTTAAPISGRAARCRFAGNNAGIFAAALRGCRRGPRYSGVPAPSSAGGKNLQGSRKGRLPTGCRGVPGTPGCGGGRQWRPRPVKTAGCDAALPGVPGTPGWANGPRRQPTSPTRFQSASDRMSGGSTAGVWKRWNPARRSPSECGRQLAAVRARSESEPRSPSECGWQYAAGRARSDAAAGVATEVHPPRETGPA